MPPYDKYQPYAGPRREDNIWSNRDQRRAYDRQSRKEAAYRDKVGRVITQEGLEGALVVEWREEEWQSGTVGTFKVRLKDGTIAEGEWNRSWQGETANDPAGVSSNGWTVGDIEPSNHDEVPF